MQCATDSHCSLLKHNKDVCQVAQADIGYPTGVAFAGASSAVHVSIRVSEAASAQDETVVYLMLSHHQGAAANAHSCSESNVVESSASFEATEATHSQKPAPTTAGQPAANPQTHAAPRQQSSTGAVSTVNAEQDGNPVLPDGTGTASTAESPPPSIGCSPGSRALGGGPSKSWGLPLPWPLPSWRPPTITAAVPTTTTATNAASMPAATAAATSTIIVAATTSNATSAASSAATPAATSAATPAAAQAHLTANSPQKVEPSLADTAFHSHGASEALTSPNTLQDSASPLVTAQACTSGVSSDSAQHHESSHTGGSVPGSDSAQCLESARTLEANPACDMRQQPHKPDSVASSGSQKRLVTAASLSVAPSTDAITDADGLTDAHTNTAAASQYDARHRHYDHLNLGLGFPSQLEEPFPERTASDAPSCPQVAAHDSAEVTQVAAPESANLPQAVAPDSTELAQVVAPESAYLPQAVAPSSADITDSSELAGMKPEQKALLAKGLQLCMQVHQVPPFSRSHPNPCPSQPLQSSCS